MLSDIFRQVVKDPVDGRPACGIFYAIDGHIVTRNFCRWAVDTQTGRVLPEYDGWRVEHRDFWDDVIRTEYPEIVSRYNDDHKALPRGRVECISEAGVPLRFRVTLCGCLDTPEFHAQIEDAFCLGAASVEYRPDAMNYTCGLCRSLRIAPQQ